MKKLAVFLVIMLVNLTHAEAVEKPAGLGADRPRPNDQMRLERRSTAYKKALNQAVIDKPLESTCYYTMSGCSDEVLAKTSAFGAEGRPPRQYPMPGYLLGTDGLYHFNSGALSRY